MLAFTPCEASIAPRSPANCSFREAPAALTHGEANVVPTTLSRARLGFGTGRSFREALAALTQGEANVVPTTLSRAHLEFRTGNRFPTTA